ncbi:hypothetical protein T05_1401 [Trichinella murrelli]|uniref:Uncharacterized protein n=1 Tax=Trichinella murrelli TaxID=144512 RepID=A0A0V0U3U8_9BILA|nr:hypothetical protein T05_1401 [Trichinella murrelli]
MRRLRSSQKLSRVDPAGKSSRRAASVINRQALAAWFGSMSGEKAGVGRNRPLSAISRTGHQCNEPLSRAGSFVTPTGLLTQLSLGDDGPVSTGGFLRAVTSSVWLPSALLPFLPSSSVHGKILAFTR